MKEDKPQSSYSNLYIGIVYTVLAVLLFLSMVQGADVLGQDFANLREANLTFFRVISLDFPVVDNIIGPFGAFFGYVVYEVFGFYVGFTGLVALLLAGVTFLLFPEKKSFFIKAIFIALLSLFANLFVLAVHPPFAEHSGLVVTWTEGVLHRVFGATGSAIIGLTAGLGFLVAIIETERTKRLIFSIIRVVGKFFSALFISSGRKYSKPIRSNTPHKKEKNKSKLKPKVDELEAGSETEPSAPPMMTETPASPKITDYKENRPKEEVSKQNSDIEIKDITEDDELEKKKKQQQTIPAQVKQQGKIITDKYVKPEIDKFLQIPPAQHHSSIEDRQTEINSISRILTGKLENLGIEADVVNVNVGPVITQFELRPAPNVKVSRFSNVSNDLALAIKAKSIRVQAPIPGKGLVGVEIPNRDREIIYLREVLASDKMHRQSSPLSIALGKDIVGNPVVADLAKMPHLLIAGATGSGKSVCVNSIICNLLFRADPETLRLVLIDPKRIELSGYEGIPHLIQNIVSDNDDALAALNWAVNEMERRYELLQQHNVRDINSYNKKIKGMKKAPDTDENYEHLPLIVIIIDEFADLILKSGRDVEMPITRLAQMARAIGIHLIIATQRPSMKIITGLIKANFPAKIAFRVAQKIDSRVILDMNGAESLLGSGDMLMITPSKALPERIHGTYVSDGEIEQLVGYLRTQPKPEQQIEIVPETPDDVELMEFDDELFIEAAKIVIANGSASVSMLQRHFKIGYARAGRLIDMLEQAGIIGKYAGSKSREIVATEEVKAAYGL